MLRKTDQLTPGRAGRGQKVRVFVWKKIGTAPSMFSGKCALMESCSSEVMQL